MSKNIKKIIIALTFLLFVVSGCFVFFINSFIKKKQKEFSDREVKALQVGYEYAKKQCIERKYDKEICDNLQQSVSTVSSEPNIHIVNVRHYDRDKFAASMFVDDTNNEYKISGYIQDR